MHSRAYLEDSVFQSSLLSYPHFCNLFVSVFFFFYFNVFYSLHFLFPWFSFLFFVFFLRYHHSVLVIVFVAYVNVYISQNSTLRPSPPTHPTSQPSPHPQPPSSHNQLMSGQVQVSIIWITLFHLYHPRRPHTKYK